MAAKDAVATWYMFEHGNVVPVFDDVAPMAEWCQQHVTCRWHHSTKPITDEHFCEEITHRLRAGDLGPSTTRLTIDILKETVTAKTRKLSANWTFEIESAPAYHGIDIEQEIMHALSSEIQAEVDHNIMSTLQGISQQAIRLSRPKGYFAFADARIATLFKLTWGGE